MYLENRVLSLFIFVNEVDMNIIWILNFGIIEILMYGVELINVIDKLLDLLEDIIIIFVIIKMSFKEVLII